MRLVCVADTHMFHADLGALPHGDVLVHAGDMGRLGDEEELTEAIRWLGAQPHRHKVAVAGNHDSLFQDQPEKARALCAAAGVTYLEDEERVIEGVRFWGSPWTPVFFDWAFMLPRGDAIGAKWARIPARDAAGGLDVLVTHGPPHGILDDAAVYRDGSAPGGAARHVGCEALLARVRAVRPRVHLFGHIHGNQGVVDGAVLDPALAGTRFVNCTTDECERAPVIVDV